MSAHSTELVTNVAHKLGICNSTIINSAREIIRNVNSKSKIPVNEMLKTVICLNLAVTQHRGKFDQDMAFKLAVVTKKQYQKTYYSLKSLLDIRRIQSIDEICVQFGCESLSKKAQILLTKYKEHDSIDEDLDHPMYAYAAVYTMYMSQNIPVNKELKLEFSQSSRLNLQQWIKLTQKFQKFAKEQNLTGNFNTKITKTNKNGYLDSNGQKSVEEKETESQIANPEIILESYEVWRSRILKEAYEHCKME